MKKKKVKFIIGGIIIAVAIVYLVYSGIQKAGLYYLTVSEVSELKKEGSIAYGQSVRVNGRVLDGSIHWDSQESALHFTIGEGAMELPVVYKGVVPDTFKGGTEVVVEGKYTSENIFEADKIMPKCPSKYEAQENEG